MQKCGNILIVFLSSLLFLGCDSDSWDEADYEALHNIECICPDEQPDDYPIDISFVDADDKERTCQMLMEFHTVNYKSDVIPCLIMDIAVHHETSIQHFYSRDMPKKSEDGLLVIDDLFGPNVFVQDNNSIVITQIPITKKTMSDESRAIQTKWNVYWALRSKCKDRHPAFLPHF